MTRGNDIRAIGARFDAAHPIWGNTGSHTGGAVTRGTGRLHALPLALLLLGLVATPKLEASPRHLPPLSPLPVSPGELARGLEPLLTTGEVLYFEADPQGAFKQVTVLTMVPRSVDAVFTLLRNPEEIKAISPSVESVEILETTETSTLYRVKADVPFSTVTYTAKLELHPPDVIDVQNVDGDVTNALYRWTLVPMGTDRCVILYTLRTDVGESSFIARKVVEKRPDVQFVANGGVGLITTSGLKRLLTGATEQESLSPSPWAHTPVSLPARLEASDAWWTSLRPLLTQGLLVHVESAPSGRFKRVTAYQQLAEAQADVYELLSRPEHYPSMVSNLTELTVLSRTKDVIRCHTTINIMLLSFEQTEVFRLTEGKISRRVLEGDLVRASLLETRAVTDSSTLLAYSVFLDAAPASWMIRKFYRIDPLMEHIIGLSGSFNLLHGMEKHLNISAGISSDE